MLTFKGGLARLKALLTAAVLSKLENADISSNIRASGALTKALATLNPKAFIPPTPIGGWGRDTKGPMPRHPLWPLNHYSTKWHPTARHGEQERARRMRQIAKGQLRSENGLAL